MIPKCKKFVKKQGDTMDGPLVFYNVNDFSAINKSRVVDGETYNLKVGIGADKAGALEISKNETVLGRISIMTNGTIKNYKSNKILAEQDSGWHTATRNDDILSSGTCKYIQIGNILLIQIQDLKPIADVSDRTVALFSDLPTCSSEIFIVSEMNGKTCRLRINNGQITCWYKTLVSSGDQFYGNVIATI
jgi:hypothetical protein